MPGMSGENESWRLPVRRVNNERVSVVYRAVLAFARAVVPLVSVRHWRGQETIPKSGGVLVVSNHLSNFDALALGEYLIYSGRWPRFLGKSDIFRIPVLGWIARKCRQIPVYRNTDRARDALIAAEQALEAGDPIDLSPWAGRTDKEAQLEVTEVILDTLTAMVSEIRGIPAPEGRYDARVGARVTRP